MRAGFLGASPVEAHTCHSSKRQAPWEEAADTLRSEQTCALQWGDTGVMSLVWEEERLRVSDDLRLDAMVKRPNVHQNLNFPLSFI